MLAVGGSSYSSTRARCASPADSTTSSANTARTNDTMSSSTTFSSSSGALDDKFCNRFVEILQRWQTGSVTADDIKYLRGITMSELDYIALTERYPIRHGIELVDYHIELLQCPTSVHERVTRIIDIWMYAGYGREVIQLGSMSNPNSFAPTINVLALPYGNGRSKQADASFAPRGLPHPSR